MTVGKGKAILEDPDARRNRRFSGTSGFARRTHVNVPGNFAILPAAYFPAIAFPFRGVTVRGKFPLPVFLNKLIDTIMAVRGVRGAITVTENCPKEILAATRELLEEVIARNQLQDFSEIVSAIFTTTPDLNAVFPAEAAREIGMSQVPLLCASEIAVPHGLPRVIRVLLHVNSDQPQSAMTHIYLRDAKKLRKDIAGAQ